MREQLGEPEQHQCAPPRADAPASAATTRSIRMKREPLTSTVIAGARVGGDALRERIDRCRNARRRRRTPRRPRAPARRRRRGGRRPRSRAYAPISRWNAGPCAPTSPMSPSTSQRGRRRARASTSIAARTESGFALYVSSMTATPFDVAQRREPAARPRETPRGRARSRRAARRRERGRRSGERIARHVPARRTRARPCASPAASQRERAAVGDARHARADVGRRVEPERRRRRAAPRARRRARQTSHARSSALTTATPPCAAARAIASACSAATSATLRMNSWCSRCALVTTAIVGCAIAASSARLAAMVHADLDHGEPMRGAQREQRQRQADRVVEVARASRARRAPELQRGRSPRSFPSSSSCRCCRRRRRPECRSGCASASRARASAAQRVVDGDQVAGERGRARVRRPAPRRRRAAARARRSRGRRSARLSTRRTDRRGASARVSVVTREKAHGGADDGATDGARGGRRVHHARAPTRERFARRPRVGERRRARRSFPGSPRDPCRRSARRRPHARRRARASIARRAVELDAPAPVPAMSRVLRRSSSAIACGSSLRGLSLVTMTRSAKRRGDAAHLRPLARVAIAAAAEHADQLAACGSTRGPQRREHLLERVGRMRVVDDDERLPRRRRSAASGPAAA